jgi:hypothetical protein
MSPEFIDKEKCHYCGREFSLDTNDLSRHLHQNTETLAELPGILGQGMQMGSIDLHDGRLYSVTVRAAPPGACFDDVRTQIIHKDDAKMMILAELSFHEQMIKRLESSKDSVFAKIENL